MYGVPIQKKKKKHRLTFRDNIPLQKQDDIISDCFFNLISSEPLELKDLQVHQQKS